MYTVLISDPKTGGHLVNGPATSQELKRYALEFGFEPGDTQFPFKSSQGLIALIQQDGNNVYQYPK